jgi:hypothetical protein
MRQLQHLVVLPARRASVMSKPHNRHYGKRGEGFVKSSCTPQNGNMTLAAV